MRVYIEVSKNHNIPIGEVIKRKFEAEMQLLIRYYSNTFYEEYHEYERIEKEQKKMKK